MRLRNIKNKIAVAAVAIMATSSQTAQAVEGGMGAYLLGSRSTFAGIVPGPGNYIGLDMVTSSGNVEGLSLGGLPIRADTDIDVTFTKFSYTRVIDATVWTGTPAINFNLPLILDAKLGFTGVTGPVNGLDIEDTTSGLGDLTITPTVGWHKGMLHYSVGMSIFAPTGSYDTATVDVPGRTINALNTGKNIWSFQPVFAITHMNTNTGLEFSGAASILFSTRNDATDYQNAPALNLEATVMQHLPSGWAFGMSGYAYQQLDDDSGSGATSTKAALEANSLKAHVYGIGPAVTFSQARIFGKEASLQFKYYHEFGAKRRFESDTFWLNVGFSF